MLDIAIADPATTSAVLAEPDHRRDME